MKRSFNGNSPARPLPHLPLSQIHLEQFPTYKHTFSQVTIETNDEDVPFIALFKPNIHIKRQRNQAASKIALITKGIESMRLAHAYHKLLTLAPLEKLYQAKTAYFSQLFEIMVQRRKQKAMKSLIVCKIKKGNSSLAAKIVWKIQTSTLNKNIRNCFDQLLKNKLVSKVKQLSSQNVLAQQLENKKEEVFKLREQAFSQQFINVSKQIEKAGSFGSVLSTVEQQNYKNVIRNELKRFEQIRQQQTPRRKLYLNNQVIATVLSNIIGAFQQSTKHYDKQVEELQTLLKSYQDTEGINQLRQVIRQKDHQLKQIELFVAQLTRMDNELHKFTLENKFQIDRINSTVNSHNKKLQAKLKNLEQIPTKLSTCRTYNNSIITSLISKIEDAKRQRREAETAIREEVKEQLDEFRQCKRELQALRNDLKQERNKLGLVVDKRQIRRGLEDLRRTWKGHQELKILLEYLIVLHQKIEELEKQEKVWINYEKDIADGIQYLINYVDQGLENIKQSNILPKAIPPNRLKDEPLKSLRSSFQRVFRLLLDTNKQRQQLLQSTVKISYHSQAQTVKPKSQTPSKPFVREQGSKLQRSSIKSQSESKEQQSEWIKNDSQSIIKQLKRNLEQFKIQLQKSQVQQNQGYQSIQESLNRIENTLSQYRKQFDNISKQLTENNNLIKKLNQKSDQPIQRSNAPRQTIQKSDAASFKQYQEEISRLKSQIQQSFVSQRKQSSQNKSLLTKIIQLQNELLQKTNQVQQDESPALLRQLRERMLMIQTKMDIKRDVNGPSLQDNSVSSALSRIQQLMDLLKQSQKNVTELTNRNNQISQSFDEKRYEYQEKIRLLQNQLNQKDILLKKQAKNMPLNTDRNQELVSKNFQLQEQIIKLKYQVQLMTKSQEKHIYTEVKQENKLATEKISHQQIEITRKNAQIDRIQYQLRQTQNIIISQRQKSSYLESQIRKLHLELDQSHNENERIAVQTKQEMRKITMVLRSMEEELDEKTKQFEELNRNLIEKQNIIGRLQNEKNNYQQQLRQVLLQCTQLQEKNSSLYGELAHIKADFYSMQVQLTTNQTSKISKNINYDQVLNLQSQIKGKDETINSILERSKAQSSTLNQQIYEVKQQLLTQQRKYEEQLSVKNALINKLEHRIVQLETNMRMLQQRCQLLQKNVNKPEAKVQKSEAIESRDRQIQYLHKQIASLQAFLSDMSHQYKQLENKYRQEKSRYGSQYDYSRHENSLQQIDRAINSLGDSSELSEQVKNLIINNEQLQISVEELEVERRKLLEKTNSQPERQYVIELLFNILLGARKIPAQSQSGSNIWNELVQLNQKCSNVGQLFTELEALSLRLLSLRD